MRRILEQLILEGGFEIAEACTRRTTGCADLRPCVADAEAEIFGDALVELSRDIHFASGGVSAV